jgi:hypothetical protein
MRVVVLWLVLALSGCCSAACDEENLPHAGRADDPEKFFDLAQHAGRNDCGGLLWELTSPRTREEYKQITFSTFWDSDDAILYPRPPVEDDDPRPRYTLAEVLQQASYLGASDPRTERGDGMEKGERLLYVEYERKPAPAGEGDPAEKAKLAAHVTFPNVTFELILVPEKVEGGRTEWRLGLQEHIDRRRTYINNVTGERR